MPIDLSFSQSEETFIATVSFSRDINSLVEIGDFAEGFVKLENIRNRLILLCLRESARQLDEGLNAEEVGDILSRANHQLLNFRIGSSPLAVIAVTLSFLSLMVAVDANYEKLGPNFERMEHDGLVFVHRISGLSNDLRERVGRGALAIGNYALAIQESAFTELARETSDIRKRLNGNNTTHLEAKIDVQERRQN